MDSSAYTVLFVPIVGLLLYRRFRRAFMRQELVLWRIILRFLLLAAVAIGMLVKAPTGLAIGVELAAIAIGIGLSFVGIKHTKLERTTEGVFYTPNKWLGLVVSAIFIGRIVARMFSTYTAIAAGKHMPTPYAMSDPATIATLGCFCLLAGYYCAYYVGLWQKSRALAPLPPA